jgi:hypothetical protein
MEIKLPSKATITAMLGWSEYDKGIAQVSPQS